MHLLAFAGLALLPCSLLGAQDPATHESPKSYQELQAEYKGAKRSWNTAYSAARTSEDQTKARKLLQNQPETEFATRFLAASKTEQDSEGQVDCLVWICSRAYQTPEAKQALATLLDQHIDSPKLGGMLQMVIYIDRPHAAANFDRIVEEGHPDTKVPALFQRAEFLSQGKQDAKILAKADYEQVIASASDKRLVDRAKRAIYEIEHLAIGMTAPEIEGKDLDGVDFKLSDYRGKVVMIDFWGDW